MILKEIYEFDDIITEAESEYLETYVHLINDWKYYEDINLGESENKKFRPGYVSGGFDNKTKEIINKIITNGLKKINFTEIKKQRIKINKTTPIQIPEEIAMRGLHIDGFSLGYKNHIVMIYYINENNGDTLISDYHIDKIPNVDEFTNNIETGKITDYKIIKKIPPKKGKVVIFDGGNFHCGLWPTKKDKFLININVEVIESKRNKLI